MSKKIIGLIAATVIVFSLAACGEKADKDGANAKNSTQSSENINKRSVGDNEKTKDLQGVWASKEFTHESFKEEGSELAKKIKAQNEAFGLPFKEEEKVEEIDGVTANVKSVYLDNEATGENKLESMKFNTEFLGASQEGGKFSLKMSLKFNGEGAVKDGKFNLGETSLAKYAAILTGEEDRNYSELNKKIMDIIKSDKPDGVIEDSINGLHEEIAVSKDYIVYTLTTKEYKFQTENNTGE